MTFSVRIINQNLMNIILIYAVLQTRLTTNDKDEDERVGASVDSELRGQSLESFVSV